MNETVYIVESGKAELVRRRIAEAAAWCSHQSAVGNSLRTPELRPSHPFIREEKMPNGRAEYKHLDTAGRLAEVERLVMNRAALLSHFKIAISDVSLRSAEGRLLLAEFDYSMWDCLSQHESGGFFDEFDIPAWDTWIDLRHTEKTDVLLCWVPKSLVPIVDQGIHVNCPACISWLDRLIFEE
jgi:hypothetical protein